MAFSTSAPLGWAHGIEVEYNDFDTEYIQNPFQYTFLLAALFLMQIIGSVLVFVYYPIAKDEAQLSIRNYSTSPVVAGGWDTFQGVVI